MVDELNARDDSIAPDGFPPNVSAIVQWTIIRGEMPALVVVHDEEGDWLIGDGVNDPNLPGACGLFHINHVLAIDASLVETSSLLPRQVATRHGVDEKWQVSNWRYGEEW